MADNHDRNDRNSADRPASRDSDRTRSERGPDYVGYTLKDRGEGQEPFWLAIGAAWKHEDGKGMTLHMDAAPLDGRLTLREKRREEYEKSRESDGQSRERSQSRDR